MEKIEEQLEMKNNEITQLQNKLDDFREKYSVEIFSRMKAEYEIENSIISQSSLRKNLNFFQIRNLYSVPIKELILFLFFFMLIWYIFIFNFTHFLNET